MDVSKNNINIDSTPLPPNIGYYDVSQPDNFDPIKPNTNFSSYKTIAKNIKQSCSISSKDGIYTLTDTGISDYITKGTSELDIPYYLAKGGVLFDRDPLKDVTVTTIDSCNKDAKPVTVTTSKNDQILNPKEVKSLTNVINSACMSNQKKIVNQIQYLTCQLENARNYQYDSSKVSTENNSSIKSFFEKNKSLKIPLMLIFLLTMYFFISGFFGSLDIVVNVFSLIEKNSQLSYSYWAGLLLGLALPVIILCIIYSKIVCKNLSDLENYDITNNAYGQKNNIDSELKNFDLLILVLFILLIYAFVAVLFTIKKSFFSPFIYTGLVGTIFFVIAIFIYILYVYIPFFNTTNTNQMINMKTNELKLFVDNQQTISTITDNQHENSKIRKAFLMTMIVIIVFALFYFMNKNLNSFFSGLLGSSAILILPILWVFNFIIALQYFYVYPIILIFLRFIRYFLMSIIYIITEKNSSMKDKFSEDLIEKLDNFKNYSASWGLIGIDEMKIFLGFMGYENEFSRSIISENNTDKNLSHNKFVSSGAFGFLFNMIAGKDTNIKGIIYSGILFILTILASLIILFGIVKV